ncbi:MAG: plasmid pRiA4b ORF-3 family protein [Bacillota bacterium]
MVGEGNVYRFKVTLKGIRPPIWRRIEVLGNYTFYDLHVAIQDAMGWQDYHLHEFEVRVPTGGVISIGLPDDEFGRSVLPGWKTPLRRFFGKGVRRVTYVYDFGDYWQHEVVLEEITRADQAKEYPRLLKGKRACPPEDCGGVPGYYHLLKTLSDPENPAYQETLEWVRGAYDPEFFDPDQVFFDDPAERLKDWLEC